MFPNLFSIGPLTIHSYGVLVALGCIVGLIVTVKIGKSLDVSKQQVMDMGFVMILSAIIGSRLLYVLINFPYYLQHPLDVFKIWQGGLVFSGALIGVIGTMFWYVKRYGLTMWTFGDLWAPAAALGQAIGRIGCFMAGCCYGKPTQVKWAVTFTNPKSLAPLDVALHPTQVYSTLSGTIIFLVLLVLHRKRKFEGQVLLWFLILHSTARLFLERFRGDDRGLVLGGDITVTQLVAILILIASVIALIVRKTRWEKGLPRSKGQS